MVLEGGPVRGVTIAALVAMTIFGGSLAAQEWDGHKNAKGWCRLDFIDGTGTFYDAAARRLYQWAPGAGTLKTVNAVNMDMSPDRWMIDGDNVWLVVGATLKKYRATGELEDDYKLPAEVADLELVPQDGFYLSYKTLTPYVEKRSLKNGSVVWSHGDKPRRNETTSRILHRITANGDRNIILASGDGLFVDVLDNKKGNSLGQTYFTYQDKEPPALKLEQRDRPPLVWWFGQGVAFQALPASAVPSLGLQGTVLARLDFSASAVEFLPTPFSEGHLLVGVQEDRAVFVGPNGGMAFVPIR
ncbi:MAG: hypothetical protein BWY56_00502 [Acidobacteria bacterium ADurb.Bin340]|nr:MAG: hypothetical protein BWY56_00502 [Acidobacteria bacterium ADurb.Bin340]